MLYIQSVQSNDAVLKELGISKHFLRKAIAKVNSCSSSYYYNIGRIAYHAVNIVIAQFGIPNTITL